MAHYAADIETLADVIKAHVWDESTITKRADWIAEKVNQTWPSYLPEEEPENMELLSVGTMKLSLNGGPIVSMSRFVFDVVRAYLKNHPESTYSHLKSVFHDDLCCYGYRFKGLLCSEVVYNNWVNKLKEKRYMPNARDRRLISADGVTFYVNTQWTKDGIGGIIKIAKAEGFKVATNSPGPTLFDN